MIFADVLGIALSIVGFLLSLQGLWLLCRAVWPGRVERAAERCERLLVCLLIGIPVTGGTAVAAIIAGRSLGTFGQILAWIIGGAFLLYAGSGVSGLATFVGGRLPSPIDIGRPWRATLRGGIVMEFAFLLPIIGWFGLLPLAFLVGAGAMTLSFFRRRATIAPPVQSAFSGRERAMDLPALDRLEALS